MTTDRFQEINHCLPKDILVLFILPEEFRRELFDNCLAVLEEKSGFAPSDSERNDYWHGIQQRMAGTSRWDVLAPRVDHQQDFVGYSRALNRIKNIIQRRPYKAFSIAGIQYLIDVFNPVNELKVDYPGAGDPVLVLQLAEESFGYIENHLFENEEFYEILRRFSSLTGAKTIVGMNAANLTNLIRVYFEKSVAPDTDPWSFLFPLQVIKLTKHVGEVTLRRYFQKSEGWGDDRLLLQVKTGIDYTINRQNRDAAKLLGMTAVQDLNPDVRK